MITFNWDELQKQSKGDFNKIIEYFTNVYVLKGTMYDYLKTHEWAARAFNSEPKNNYILNIDDLVLNELNATPAEMYVYIDLASKRDLFTYHNTKGNVIFLYSWKIEKETLALN